MLFLSVKYSSVLGCIFGIFKDSYGNIFGTNILMNCCGCEGQMVLQQSLTRDLLNEFNRIIQRLLIILWAGFLGILNRVFPTIITQSQRVTQRTSWLHPLVPVKLSCILLTVSELFQSESVIIFCNTGFFYCAQWKRSNIRLLNPINR